ncbi:MAG: hypothetical protein AAFN41_13505, partial [Planctomycetota bacterium]
MAQILVLQHGNVGPVRLGATLRDHGFRLDIRKVAKPDNPDALPPNLDEHQGVISLGFHPGRGVGIGGVLRAA